MSTDLTLLTPCVRSGHRFTYDIFGLWELQLDLDRETYVQKVDFADYLVQMS